jgi:hypothetical protein
VEAPPLFPEIVPNCVEIHEIGGKRRSAGHAFLFSQVFGRLSGSDNIAVNISIAAGS